MKVFRASGYFHALTLPSPLLPYGARPTTLILYVGFQLFSRKTFLETLLFTCVAPILARYFGIWRPNWWDRVGSNRRPVVFQTTALAKLSYRPIKSSTAFTQRPRGGTHLISTKCKLEQVVGIEPTTSAWQADVLPLNYTCKTRPVYLPESRPRC